MLFLKHVDSNHGNCTVSVKKGEKVITVVGKYINKGKVTLYLTAPFEPYFTNEAEARIAEGKNVKSVYVGEYDVSNIKIGSEIDIYYGEPVNTKNGTYAPIRKIELLK